MRNPHDSPPTDAPTAPPKVKGLAPKAHVYFDATLDEETSQGKIAAKIPPSSSVLEFGPGSGILTRYMTDTLKCDVTIVELDPDAAADLSTVPHQAVVCDIEALSADGGYVWEEQLGPRSFDVILLADVLEHLRDPWSVLAAASRFLRPGGRVFISVPNVCHSSIVLELLADRFDYTDSGILDDSHLRFFNLRSLEDLCLQAGLRPTEIDATYEYPERTPSRTNYLDVPLWTATYIASRPHAQVFQFIVTAMHEEESSRGGRQELIVPRHLDLRDQVNKRIRRQLRRILQRLRRS